MHGKRSEERGREGKRGEERGREGKRGEEKGREGKINNAAPIPTLKLRTW